jgi:Protein of unknown function (DUF2380)
MIRSLALFLLVLFPWSSAPAAQRTILILNFEIEDDMLAQGAPVDVSENERRLVLAHGVMTEVFKERAVFGLANKSSVDAMIANIRQSQALHTCNGCEIEIARQAGADYVLVGWVQKVSNLILNVNAGIKDVKSGEYLLTRSVDLRGNTDSSWIRAVKRLGADLHTRLSGEALQR